MRNIIFIKILCLLAAQRLCAQVVNIEAERIKGKDSIGWVGTLGANVNWVKNTNSILQVEGNTHLQHNHPRGTWLLVARTSVLQDNSNDLANETFAHLRYTHRLNRWLRVEGFGQIQNNIVTRIKLRSLGGVGLRFKLANTSSFAAYTGTGFMYEYTEQLTKPEISTLREYRSTNYFTLNWQPSQTFNFLATCYYQPLLASFDDYRATGEAKAAFKITKQLSFNAKFRFLSDTNPAPNAPKTTFAWLNGLEYCF